MRDIARRRAGFVLVMVLLVLMVAGTILAGAALRSCGVVLRAGARERELQVRWGSQSCQDFFLANAERFLREADVDRRSGAASTRRTIILGGMSFHVTVGDEQAKANANALLSRHGRIGLEVALRRLQRDLRRMLLVRPQAQGGLGAASPDALFVMAHPSEFFEPDGRSRLLDRVTCWGSGKVNFKRADVCVLEELLDGVLTGEEIEKLVRARNSKPDGTLAEALGELTLSKERGEQLLTLITDTSLCHSVWVAAEGKTRTWYRLYVVEGAKVERKTPRRVFLW